MQSFITEKSAFNLSDLLKAISWSVRTIAQLFNNACISFKFL